MQKLIGKANIASVIKTEQIIRELHRGMLSLPEFKAKLETMTRERLDGAARDTLFRKMKRINQ